MDRRSSDDDPRTAAPGSEDDTLTRDDDRDDDRPVGWWLTRVERLLDQRFAEALDEHGVTRRQWQVLEGLERGVEPGDEESSAASGSTASSDGPADDDQSLVDDLGELVESGWVTVETDGLGASRHSLTERGAVAHAKLRDVVLGIGADAFAGVSPDDRETALRVLRRAVGNLGG
ncbi:MarR family winged helix-turn-helix transcriptional regulator [uncultured Frigoribacterium sp.]|uniref:MarR family winged helix-turn-helix transcriptional regulator n=1 Tax=uncultured Frigoribacterium sp. TaxID=335377 RepID=UPI0028D48ACC|nr:MarR family winged helix-turn-helix transcriptional regulator [uncultured Frigoribacterium sp.]